MRTGWCAPVGNESRALSPARPSVFTGNPRRFDDDAESVEKGPRGAPVSDESLLVIGVRSNQGALDAGKPALGVELLEVRRRLRVLVLERTERGLQEVVDIPDRRLDLFIRLCLQNKGRLAKAKTGI